MAKKPKAKVRDLTGTGWTLADIGVTSETPGVTTIKKDGTVVRGGNLPAEFTLGLTGGGAGQPVIPTTPTKLGAAPPSSGTRNYLPDAVNPSQGVVTNAPVSAAQSQQVKNYLDNPNIIENVASGTKSWLSNLFDTSDDAKEAFWGLENPWDKALTGVGWFYDKINQVGTWGVSVAPGGLDTFSWDEAKGVSFGQAAVTNQAKLNEDLGTPLGTVAGALFNPAGVLGGNYGEAVGAKFTDDNFNILDANQRKAAFQDDAAGKWASGLTDTAFTIFADPLIMGGKVVKIARINWVDRPVQSLADIERVTNELKTGAISVAAGEADRAAPIAQFAAWATEKTDLGDKARSIQDIFWHPVIKRAADREGLTSALYNADNYDDASLVLRYAYGDKAARAELLEKRADLADELDAAQRGALQTRIAYNPEVWQKQIDKTGKTVEKMEGELKKVQSAWARGEASDEALDFSRRQFDKALDDQRAIKNMELPDPLENPVSKADVDAADAIVKQLMDRNKFFQKAVREESQNINSLFDTLSGSRSNMKGFAADNAFGRAVERRRIRSAEAMSQASRTRGARVATEDGGTRKLKLWESDVFGNNGMTRTLRLWRYAGMEAPSGYITTKGAGSQESVREIMAALNEIKIYSGEARTVRVAQETKIKRSGKEKIIQKPYEGPVGGVQRKDELVRMYMDALSDTTRGTESAKYAVDRIEKAIADDIAKWYGVPKSQAEQILWKAQGKRSDTLEQIRRVGYWVEEGKINKSPYLESQLQNGTYMLNFRAFEKSARLYDESSLVKSMDSFRGTAGTKANEAYEFFNDFWRPAVLLRLGYTQRNVLEGLFRSTAFMFSLAPAKYALEQGGYGVRNAVVRTQARADIKRLEKVGDTPRFTKWRENQINALDDAIIDNEERIRLLREESKVAGADVAADVADDIRAIEKVLESVKTGRQSIMEDDVAKALYREQAMQKRRVFDGSATGMDGRVMREAFNNDGGYADIAWANMSADNTTRSVASLSSTAYQGLLRRMVAKTNVEVNPGQPGYAAGVTSALNQFKNSEVGRMVVEGATPDEIASFLRKTPEGREIAAFVTRAQIKKKGNSFVSPIVEYDDALDYATMIINRYAQIAPTAELRAYTASTRSVSEASVEGLLKNIPEAQLKPVVGNISEEVGALELRDLYKRSVNRAFKVLGTMPEDSFVRGPFYGMRYKETVNDMVAKYTAQTPGGRLSMKDADAIQRIAHRRALKDTKDWLYTIDRRTLLGKYGEYMFPFISATQNSVSAVGRIIWNDPSFAGVLLALWNAPDKMGIVDENGKISVAMPLGLIPDGVKEAFGLDNMMNVEFEKSQFNVIFPESGYGFLPRFGPLGAVPASEMMKIGWFGQSVETPGWLKGPLDGAFGAGAADEVWRNWKDYLFGEDQGISPEFLSWDKLAPPVAAKFVQMWQGEGSSSAYTYQYNLQMRTEYAKWIAGYRAEPTAEEIKERTNKFQISRIIANLTAFTPPSYESKLDPLIKAIRENDKKYGIDGPRQSNEMFGNLLLMLGDWSNAKNTAGIKTPSADAVGIARSHAGLISKIAPNLGDDMNTLGILFNQNPDALYDESAYAWQRANNIPGTTEKFREVVTPEEALRVSQKNAGWTAFMQLSAQLQALLEQRGLKSFRSAGAEQLRDMRDQAVIALRDNPLYEGWYDDYMDYGSQRTNNALEVLGKAVSDEGWMKEYGGTPIWQAAQQYLGFRNMVIEGVAQTGKSINDKSNANIREFWDTVRAQLISKYNGWDGIATRYLSGDDNPNEGGASLYDDTTTTAQAGMRMFDDPNETGDFNG